MSLQSQGERLLRGLGLTSLQARVYIALATIGEGSTVREISRSSNVARQDIYQVIEELQELSLIEKEIGTLSRFEAIPLQEAISLLLERRTATTSVLMKEARELLQKFPKKEVRSQQDKSQFVLVPAKIVRCRIEKAIEAVEETLCVIKPWRECTQWLCSMPELHQKILNRGVKIKYVTGKPENQNSFLKVLQDLMRHPNFQLRTSTDPGRSIRIHDNKEVFITTISQPTVEDAPALFTNNSSVVDILTSYFETKWKLATPFKPKESAEEEKTDL